MQFILPIRDESTSEYNELENFQKNQPNNQIERVEN